MKNKKIIGIDLGTTRTAVYKYDESTKTVAQVMAFDSAISFKGGKDGEVIIGKRALANKHRDPSTTFTNFKVLTGVSESEIPAKSSSGTTKQSRENSQGNGRVISREQIDNLGYTVEFKSGSNDAMLGGTLTVQQAQAHLLMYIKRKLKEEFGDDTEFKVVITVPAFFTSRQRDIVRDLAQNKAVGFEVISMINEPVAAAVAYIADNQDTLEKYTHILVPDLGGGTFDVSLLEVNEEEITLDSGEKKKENVLQVVATDGLLALGGHDFDRRIINWIVEELKSRFDYDIDSLSKNKRARIMANIAEEAMNAKKALSDNQSTEIDVEDINEEIVTDSTKSSLISLTRSIFKELLEGKKGEVNYIKQIHQIVHDIISENNLSKEKTLILATGGSSKSPVIRDIYNKEGMGFTVKNGDGDNDIARGAAIQAAYISGHQYGKMAGLTLIDTTSLDLGIETVGGIMTVVVKGGSAVPLQESKVFSTAEDNQSSVRIVVYQGNSSLTENNHKLAEFDLTGIPAAPRGQPQIKVTFDIDENNLVRVTATEEKSGKKIDVSIDEGSFASSDQKEAMEKYLNDHKDEIEAKKNLKEARRNASNKVYDLEKLMKDDSAKNVSEDVKKELQTTLDDVNKTLSSKDSKIEEIKTQITKMIDHENKFRKAINEAKPKETKKEDSDQKDK